MGQVAFDTLKFVETLETAGLPKDQAKAISLAVRESHEAVDVATKRDLDDAKKDVLSEVTAVKRDLEDVHKEIDARFEKTDAQMQARFEKTDAQIADVRKDLSAEIADVRKDIANRFDKLGLQMTVRVGGMLIAAVGLMTAILKLLK
ncbi:hypothetical protein SGGMMB4_04691 [Sodalis glossinidius str. 'morsitans']|uniref:Hypothetical phage protein n=1 Tax=Sodalis glossinidius (strain morsitans) TaxID=343509 RepID=Q2NRI1_SODGM|nr:coiled-coil domain-containing protein [Sodalis glossinidius]BAE75244.1 hypothetical phage protein [Sodalis glossinidius str. 'morsitans']CRL46242.1 hypothetical protein SGGMMB4_04691 [Sodalis glossinidius str. 'morsitans']